VVGYTVSWLKLVWASINYKTKGAISKVKVCESGNHFVTRLKVNTVQQASPTFGSDSPVARFGPIWNRSVLSLNITAYA